MDPMATDSRSFRAGFVALLGKPNSGKSTLMNALLGAKIAAVSPWPQTTRKRQMGILSLENAQVIFIDTPGIHHPLHKLGEKMNQEAIEVLEGSDAVLFLVDASTPAGDEDRLLAAHLVAARRKLPLLMALNKIDLVEAETMENRRAEYASLSPQAELLLISATRGDNLDQLVEKLISRLPEAEAFFPEDQLTDLYERDFVADLIREAALFNLRAEVPHSLAVRIDEYKEGQDDILHIAATLFVERESQKGIVIGEGGSMLKKIGSMARREIESQIGRKVFLQTRVKVRKNWRNDEETLRLFGFKKS